MRTPLSPAEAVLAVAVAGLLLVAVLAPGLSQPGDYHRFADQRALWQVPMAMDVLSNLAFAMSAAFGAAALWRARPALSKVQRAMAAHFFCGLLLTASGSAWYHLAPDEAGLAIDRAGMAIAFGGLLGLAAASRVSERAGAWLGLATLILGPVAAHVAFASGNVLPWAALQFGAIAVVFMLAVRGARAGSLPLPLMPVLLAYAVAKLLELNDSAIFDCTGQIVSGHTLKHVAAAFAAAPVIFALRKAGTRLQDAPGDTATRRSSAHTAGHAMTLHRRRSK